MSIRYKQFVPDEILTSDDVNDVSYNTVVQLDTKAEVSSAGSSMPNVNVLYCIEDRKLYVRTSDTEFAELGGAAIGTPPAPTITNEDITNFTFTGNGDGSAGPTLAWGATIDPETSTPPVVTFNGANINAGGNVKVSGTTPGVTYTLTIFGVNLAGKGEGAESTPFQANFNIANGGSPQGPFTYDERQWKSHTFTSPGTFSISKNFQKFNTVVTSGGQGGGYSHPADAKGPGAPGPARVVYGIDVSGTSVNVTVGGGGGGGAAVHQNGGGGGPSSFGSYAQSAGGSTGQKTWIRTGAQETYPGTSGWGNGGAAQYLATGQSGKPGVVVVNYQTG